MGNVMFMRKGEVHTAPVGGLPVSSLAVGTIVKLNVDGTPTDFIVVNQGIPSNSTLYDESCNGTWLLMKDIHDTDGHNSANNDYENTNMHTFLNGDFYNLLDSAVQSIIKEVKIPYWKGTGQAGTLASGAKGLTTKVFLLSVPEVGIPSSFSDWYSNNDGVPLEYFSDMTNAKRIAYFNGKATGWFLRSPIVVNKQMAYVTSAGVGSGSELGYNYGTRPAFVLPFTALVEQEPNADGSVSLKVSEVPMTGLPVTDLLEGQIVMINENGTPVPFYLAKHDYESGLNGTGRVLLVRKEAHSEMAYAANLSHGNFMTSDIFEWLNNDYKSLLDSTIQDAMSETTYYYGTGTQILSGSSAVFLLSLMELGLQYTYGTWEGTALPIASTLTQATYGGTGVIQHVRSGHYDHSNNSYTADLSCAVMANGSATYGKATNKHYARPCFTLPSDMLTTVNDDGTVTLKV